MLRPLRIGDSGSVDTLVNRANDPAVSRTFPNSVRGCRNAVAASGPNPLTASSTVRATQPTLLRITACMNPLVSSSTGSGASGIGPRSAPSGVKSSNARLNCTAPCPSAIAWCSFCTSTDLPPGNPSSRVARHSGRSLSKSAMLCRRASSSTSRHTEPSGIRNRRMWKDRSKLGSTTTRGVSNPVGPSTTLDRSTGASRLARS